MSVKSAIGGDVVSVMTGRALSSVLQAVTFVLLARGLEPSVFGHLAVVLSIGAMSVGLADMGLVNMAAREFGTDKHSHTTSAIWAQQRTTACAAIAFAVALGLLVIVGTISAWLLVLPSALWLEKQCTGALSVAVAARARLVQTLLPIAMRAPSLVALLIFSSAGFSTLVVFVFSSLLANGVAFLTVRAVRPDIVSGSRGLPIKVLLKMSRPFWTATISGQVRMLDTLFVGWFAGAAQAGIYALPSRITGPAKLFSASVAAVAMPYAARRELESLKQLGRLIWIGTGAFAIAVIIVIPHVEHYIAAWIGPGYVESAGVFTVIILSLLPAFPGSYYSAQLQGQGHQHAIARLGIALAALALVSLPVAAYVAGAIGAAYVTAALNCLSFASVVILRRRLSHQEGAS